MKKLLLLILMLSPLSSMASVDESKTDVYFANGINSTEAQAWYAVDKV
jgi:hypothetical protein